MKAISAFLLYVLASTALGWAQAQTLCYVRVDGNDVECSGLVDAPDVPGTGMGENCAFKSVGTAAARCILPGANIKIRGDAGGSWYTSERVTFMASGTPSSPIVIEGHGPTQPHIGGEYNLYVNSPLWTPDPARNAFFIPYSAGPIAAAYILTSLPYEHERIGLVNYLDPNDLSAADANGHYVPGGDYYIGPGVHYDTTNSRLYIRLERTPQVTSYEQDYLNLGLGLNANPQYYQILIAHGTADPRFSIRTAANHLVFRNLSIEPGFTTVEIACPIGQVEQVAKTIVFENNTIWSGNNGAIRAVCTNRDITLRENEIRADIPYWVSWGDCKNSLGPCQPATGGWRFAMIRPGVAASLVPPVPAKPGKGWVIERNLISGGHDGYVTQGEEVGAFTDPNDIIRIRYNVFEGFQDDPFEIERPDVGRHDIYGNLIANSLVCIAVGQQTTNTLSSYGPFFFHSNTCLLLREPYVNRCTTTPCPTTCDPCQGGTFNESREYGHEYAFKLHRPVNAISSGLHVYNNTIVLTDSHPNAGMGVLAADDPTGNPPNTDAMKLAEIFNNVFIKLNRRVGQGGVPKWAYTTDPTTVNWNLYWKIHNDGGSLLDAFSTTGGLCSGPTTQECQGKGDTAFIGSDPKMNKIEGFGCFAQTSAAPVPGGGESACDGVDRDPNDPTFWKIKTGSEYWSPAMFIPEAETTVVCGQGRGSVPSGFPQYPAIEGIPFDASDIGAIPCDVSQANWNVFPFNAIWKTDQLAGGVAPDGYITAPTDPITTIAVGNSVSFCGGKTDLDGAPPYTYLWQLASGAACPSIPPGLCPGNVLFPNAGTCTYVFKVTDRWGLQDATPQQRVIVVDDGYGSGNGCSDCSRCICNQF